MSFDSGPRKNSIRRTRGSKSLLKVGFAHPHIAAFLETSSGVRLRLVAAKPALMPEMPGAGEYHGDPVIVRRFDNFAIAHRAARLDHRGRTSLDRDEKP